MTSEYYYHYLCTALADGHRWRRQADETAKKDESLEQELCKDKDAGEWFRLVAGEGDNCRDVIQCTASVRVLLIINMELDNAFSYEELCSLLPRLQYYYSVQLLFFL